MTVEKIIDKYTKSYTNYMFHHSRAGESFVAVHLMVDVMKVKEWLKDAENKKHEDYYKKLLTAHLTLLEFYLTDADYKEFIKSVQDD